MSTAKPLYDNIKRTDPPFEGAQAEALVGMAPGTVLITMRMMQLGNGPGIELFEIRGSDQRPVARLSDFGLQHFAVYVDDIALATQRFIAAGGTMFSGPNETDGLEKGDGNRWHYRCTPWGSLVELIALPGAEAYEETTPLRRWNLRLEAVATRPAARAGLTSDQPTAFRLSADCLPLRRSVTSSNSTFWPSLRVDRPARSIALMWTKASLPPLSGWMKPKPLAALNHLTVPVVMGIPFTNVDMLTGASPGRHAGRRKRIVFQD
jgi:hypothetical protein